MKCKIQYRGMVCEVGIIDKILITRIKIILYMKRIIRRLKSLIPENINLYFILTLVWIFFGICNYYFYILINNQQSVLSIIIELKNSYFTTVIIAIILNVYNKNFNYNDRLVYQHGFYTDTMRLFENIFGGLLGDEKTSFIVFYNDLCLNDTLEYIKTLNTESIDNMLNSKEFQNDLEELIEYMNSIRNYFHSTKYSGKADDLYLNFLDKSLKSLKNNLDNSNFYLKEINNISYYMYKIVEVLREPWRKDIKYNIKILKIIEKNNIGCIKDNFYCNMLLYGHNFSNTE